MYRLTLKKCVHKNLCYFIFGLPLPMHRIFGGGDSFFFLFLFAFFNKQDFICYFEFNKFVFVFLFYLTQSKDFKIKTLF